MVEGEVRLMRMWSIELFCFSFQSFVFSHVEANSNLDIVCAGDSLRKLKMATHNIDPRGLRSSAFQESFPTHLIS